MFIGQLWHKDLWEYVLSFTCLLQPVSLSVRCICSDGCMLELRLGRRNAEGQETPQNACVKHKYICKMHLESNVQEELAQVAGSGRERAERQMSIFNEEGSSWIFQVMCQFSVWYCYYCTAATSNLLLFSVDKLEIVTILWIFHPA